LRQKKKQYKMKQVILNNWNFIRFLKLGLGIAIIIQAAIAGNLTMGIAGILFTAMPLFNVGCCGKEACASPVKKSSQATKDTGFEEVV
jgi:uncharacterized membrane protein SpoIIM required for sporulation